MDARNKFFGIETNLLSSFFLLDKPIRMNSQKRKITRKAACYFLRVLASMVSAQ
jgi:hypothetical protein